MANLYQSYQATHGAEAVKDAQTPSKTLRLPDMRGTAPVTSRATIYH
jgi:hypothetical protein